MCICNLFCARYAELSAAAVEQAIKNLQSIDNSLSIIRNAGWEQTIRNLILTELKSSYPESIGFTETAYELETHQINEFREKGGKVKPNQKSKQVRADILLKCSKCGNDLLLLEIKINHFGQSEAPGRLEEAARQLDFYRSFHGPLMIVAFMVSLQKLHDNDPEINFHNQFVKTKYKRFSVAPVPQLVEFDCHGGDNGEVNAPDLATTEFESERGGGRAVVYTFVRHRPAAQRDRLDETPDWRWATHPAQVKSESEV